MYDMLNDDVLSLIKTYLPPETLVWLNKEYYLKYHSVVKHMINIDKYDDYIRDIVKSDSSFVFEQIIKENFIKFHTWKSYYHETIRHHSYLTYLRYYALTKNAKKCVSIIDDYANKNGFSSNWYKYRGVIIRSK
jgi:hypothetical protein